MNKKVADILHFFMHVKVHESLRCKFFEWLISDEDAEYKDEVLRQEWMRLSNPVPDKSVYRSWNQVRRKAGLTHVSGVSVWRRVSRVAAMWIALIVSAASVGYYVASRHDNVELLQYSVAAGHTGQLILPDGTIVMANAGTTIVYPDRFVGTTRTVYLSGEANFDVYRDPEHPFIVKTPLLAIKALGTRFDVQAYPEDRLTLTTLESGKVSVSSLADTTQSFILRPDQQLSYDRLTHDFQMRNVDVSVTSGWIAGELNFINCPVENIITVMERHYGVAIKADPSIFTNDLYNIRLKRNEPLANAIRIVGMTMGGVEWQITPTGDVLVLPAANVKNDKKGGAPQ